MGTGDVRGRDDIDTRSKYINDGTIVRVTGQEIVHVGRTDIEGHWDAGRGTPPGIDAGVTSYKEFVHRQVWEVMGNGAPETTKVTPERTSCKMSGNVGKSIENPYVDSSQIYGVVRISPRAQKGNAWAGFQVVICGNPVHTRDATVELGSFPKGVEVYTYTCSIVPPLCGCLAPLLSRSRKVNSPSFVTQNLDCDKIAARCDATGVSSSVTVFCFIGTCTHYRPEPTVPAQLVPCLKIRK